MGTRKCVFCLFFDASASECRRLPPVIVPGSGDNMGHFPGISADKFCGEFAVDDELVAIYEAKTSNANGFRNGRSAEDIHD